MQQDPTVVKAKVRRNTVIGMLALIGIAATACSDIAPTQSSTSTAPNSQVEILNQPTVFSRSSGGWMCAEPDSVVMTVDSRGGTMMATGITLSFPKNAVKNATRITMIPVIDTSFVFRRGALRVKALTMSVRLRPHGLEFGRNVSQQPQLTFDTKCIGDPDNSSIVYTDDLGLTLLELLDTRAAGVGGITTNLPHFSRYAVDW